MSTEDSSQFSPPVPGMTPAGYQRATGGGLNWQPPTVEHLQALLPQFEIVSLLGHGGMGAVYKARQITLNRLVAIKLLPPDPSEPGETDFVERFKNEARTMAMFMHPAIVAVFDFGETSEGQPYFIMEFVEGTDVEKMITSRGRLTADHALAITAHVCDALHYAHARGVVHRDIKPANVLINMEGQVKVADFGLAKMGDTHAGGEAANMTMGTPDFIAPEGLIIGVELDHRADLYSVGVMLYNMLTGEVPRGQFPPPSRSAGCDVRFDAIIARALQSDRERRYQSALEIRHDLDKILTTPVVKESAPKNATGSKPRGPRVSASAPSSVPVRKSPLAWLFPAVLTMAIASAVGWFFIFKPAEQSMTGDTVPAPDQKSPDGTASQAPDPATESTPPAPNTTAATSQTGGSRSPGAPMSSLGAPPTNRATEPGKALPPSPVASAPQPALPAELADLVTQFQKLQTERVAAPFEADTAKLNTSYLGGLDRESANENTAGHLDATLALEEEKKLVQAAGPVRLDTMGPVAPSSDEDKSQGTLKRLRGIYRLEMAKLDAQRASNQAALLASFLARLKQLEIELTKAGRLTDAKAVMDYREGHAAGVPMKAEVALSPSTPPLPPNEGVEFITEAVRKANQSNEEGIVLQGDRRFTTSEAFVPPVEITIVAKTDKLNLRMAYAADSIIFNWEKDPRQLRVDGGPAKGKHKRGAGSIPENQFITIKWIVTPQSQTIITDGKPRFHHEGDYARIDKPVSVFAKDSTVTLKSLKVKKTAGASDSR